MDQTEPPILLVTGAAGRLGAILHHVWAQDRPTFRPVWSARGGDVPAGWLCWDMLADAPPRLDLAPRAMLHLAGVTGDGPELDRNLRLAEAALRAADGYGCRTVLLASSVSVYGAAAPGAELDERAPLCPVSAYGRSKVAMERLARSRRRSGVTCLRIGNVVGADALLGEARPGKSVVLDTAPGLPNGPERSWIGPFSLARMLAALIAAALDGAALPPALNVAQGPARPMAALLEAASLPWRIDPARQAPVPRAAISLRRLSRLLRGSLVESTPQALVAEWRSLRSAA